MAVNTLKRHFYPCMPTDDKNIAINLHLLQYKMAAQKKKLFLKITGQDKSQVQYPAKYLSTS